MAFIKINAVKLACDCCGAVYDDVYGVERWNYDNKEGEEDLAQEATDGDWKEIGGKYYCESCWDWNEDGDVVPKKTTGGVV